MSKITELRERQGVITAEARERLEEECEALERQIRFLSRA